MLSKISFQHLLYLVITATSTHMRCSNSRALFTLRTCCMGGGRGGCLYEGFTFMSVLENWIIFQVINIQDSVSVSWIFSFTIVAGRRRRRRKRRFIYRVHTHIPLWCRRRSDRRGLWLSHEWLSLRSEGVLVFRSVVGCFPSAPENERHTHHHRHQQHQQNHQDD